MSDTLKDGGPAFPCGPFGDTMHGEAGRQWHQHDRMPGMSLRDWFAGQALSGNLASQCKSSFWAFNVIQNEENNKEALQGVARLCYDLADAMLAQREKDQA
jgi:hypothetical protein